MATKYVNITDIKGSWTALTTTPVASGDIVVVSGCDNIYDCIVLGLGGTTPSGTWTVSGGVYDNTRAYDSPTFSGAVYNAIGGLDGSRVSQSDNSIQVTCTTSGNFVFLKN
jgi:hypothetical protein